MGKWAEDAVKPPGLGESVRQEASGQRACAWGEAAKSSLPIYSTELVFMSSFSFSWLLVIRGYSPKNAGL